jgi:hypothetical protein
MHERDEWHVVIPGNIYFGGSRVRDADLTR